MSRTHVHTRRGEPTLIAKWIRRLAIPIVLVWLAIVAALTVLVPPLEVVAQENAVSLNPQDAPSMQAMKEMGLLFGESDSDSIALIVLEGDSLSGTTLTPTTTT